MAKFVIEFNDIEDTPEAAVRALKATDAYIVIWDMFQELRKVWKYSEDNTAIEYADHWDQKLRELCDANGIDVWNELN